MIEKLTSPKNMPMPTLPIAFSPQVRLSRLALCLSASIGPTFWLTSTGTTRKVASVHAAPRPLPSRRTSRLSSSFMRLSTRPTVAAIAA